MEEPRALLEEVHQTLARIERVELRAEQAIHSVEQLSTELREILPEPRRIKGDG